jgi:hypothetical protein
MEKQKIKKETIKTHNILNTNREDLYNEQEFYDVYREKGFTDFEIKMIIENSIQRKMMSELINSNQRIQNNVVFFFWITVIGIVAYAIVINNILDALSKSRY